MHPADIDALVVRAQAGDPEGLAILIAGTWGEVRTFAARYASSRAMVEAAVRETWAAAYRDIAGCAPGAFAGWIAGQGRRQLERLLNEGVQQAADAKDALAHVLLRPALDALRAAPIDAEGEIARLKQGVEALEAKSRQIVGKRYGEQAPIDAIAKLVGETPAKTGSLLFRARATLGGMGDLGEQLAKADPLFPGLVEDCLNGVIVPDARELLAGSVLKDLRYSAVFEAQVRSDLLLRAVLAAANLEAARTLAYALANPAPARESDRRKAARPSERMRTSGAMGERLAGPVAVRPSRGGGAPGLWIGVAVAALAIAIAMVVQSRSASPPRRAPTVATRDQEASDAVQPAGGIAPTPVAAAGIARSESDQPSFPKPLVEVLFDTVKGTATPNTGLSANIAPVAVFTAQWPQHSGNVPPSGGSGSIDFGRDAKPFAVDVPGAAKALHGLKSFTICAWVNVRDLNGGLGGNRLVIWNAGGDGVDLACHKDGSIGLGINTWNDINGVGRSSVGKITANDLALIDNWRFLAVTYDSTAASRQVRYYFGSATDKATLDKAVDEARGPVGMNNVPELAIGHLTASVRQTADDRMLRGLIDQVRIWGSPLDGSGALTAEQIVAAQGLAMSAAMRLPTPTPTPKAAVPAAVVATVIKRDIILWDGDSENAGGGWNGPGNTQVQVQNVVAHQGMRAIHAHTSGMDFANFGWNWRSWQPSSLRDDATPYANLLVAIKVDGPKRPTGMHFILRTPLAGDRNKSVASDDIDVLKYCPNALDGEWHDIAIPFKDVVGKPGFDLHRLWELTLHIWTKGPLDCDVYIDDIGYGGRP